MARRQTSDTLFPTTFCLNQSASQYDLEDKPYLLSFESCTKEENKEKNLQKRKYLAQTPLQSVSIIRKVWDEISRETNLPAKMEEDEAEKRGILCLKSIKVYGTTGDLSCSSNQFPRLYNRDYEHVEFIDHIVTERDTLQGLSLKYDCTMEDIKRYNQLWSNDSSCVRQKTILRIPIRQGSDKMPNSLNSTSNSEDSESDLVMIPDAKNSSINNENADDFFSRIDSSIQKLKKKSSMDQSLRLESFRVDQLEPNNYGITQTSLISYQNGGYEADC